MLKKPRYDLSTLFDFVEIGADVFEFRGPHVPSARLYGGQLIGQALAAAQRTVASPRAVHSLHAYFVRPGLPDLPMRYRVIRDRDGRSFSARRVEAEQNGALVFSMAASFQIPEAGPSLQTAMPDVPPPEELEPIDRFVDPSVPQFPQHIRQFWENDMGIEYRAVEPFRPLRGPPTAPSRHFWMRTADPLAISDNSTDHSALLGYASDMHLLDTGLLPLGIGWAEPTLGDASLDHSIWFHGTFRMDEWLLYVLDSPAAASNRFLARGFVFTRNGRLVATVAQEGLIRIPPAALSNEIGL